MHTSCRAVKSGIAAAAMLLIRETFLCVEQSRSIGELPSELSARGRARIMLEFTDGLGELCFATSLGNFPTICYLLCKEHATSNMKSYGKTMAKHGMNLYTYLASFWPIVRVSLPYRCTLRLFDC